MKSCLVVFVLTAASLCVAQDNYIESFGSPLGSLPMLSDAQTRSISAENPTGEPGNGAKTEPNAPDAAAAAKCMGKGWKVKPRVTLKANSTFTMAQIDGPGVIQHIWLAGNGTIYRDCVIRFYWDDEITPSVEVPLGDFFAEGYGVSYNINSLPIVVNPTGGCNSYWPMPFRKSARITVGNQKSEEIGGFYYQVTYSLTDVPEKAAYFHAQWRRTNTTDPNKPEHILLDNVKGKGHYVGTFIAWTQLSNGWWGEGEMKFFIDGDKEYPTICGTGTEDYFGGAWCFGDTYSTAFLGYPYCQKEANKIPEHALYRWHILDPIRFNENIRVSVQALGWWPNGCYQPLSDDICSTAYWYQTEPHNPFPKMSEPKYRWPR